MKKYFKLIIEEKIKKIWESTALIKSFSNLKKWNKNLFIYLIYFLFCKRSIFCWVNLFKFNFISSIFLIAVSNTICVCTRVAFLTELRELMRSVIAFFKQVFVNSQSHIFFCYGTIDCVHFFIYFALFFVLPLFFFICQLLFLCFFFLFSL